MDQTKAKVHTHWRWKPADPVRHIWLWTDGREWQIAASTGEQGWVRDYPDYTSAITVIAGMLERTGGERQWIRYGPEFTGSRFS